MNLTAEFVTLTFRQLTAKPMAYGCDWSKIE